MEVSRRTFIKTTLIGGAGVTCLRIQSGAGLRTDAGTEDRAHDGNAQHLSLLFGELRRDHSHAGRQGEECDPAGRPRRRRS